MRENSENVGQTQARAVEGERKLRPFAGYIRVSRVGERDERLRSPDFQRSACEAKAQLEGAEVVWEEPELDVSGAKQSREVLDRILEMIEAGERAGIVVYNLARLSRLPGRQRIELVERIEHAGGRIISACENFDARTPEGEFARAIFFELARLEWRRLAEGFAVAKAAAVERGTKIASLAPFGYTFGDKHRLVIVPREAAIVRELFELRASNESRGAVLKLFEERTGRRSSRQTMAYMLRNRVYLGEVHYGQVEPLVNASAHEAIIGLELFERVQAVDRARRR